MKWMKVTNPEYEQSREYQGQIGEVVGRWGRNEERDGYLVEFADGRILGMAPAEVEEITDPQIPPQDPEAARRCR